MTTQTEALKLALEALNTPRPSDSYPPLWRAYETTINSAIKACEKVLAQLEQKPVAKAVVSKCNTDENKITNIDLTLTEEGKKLPSGEHRLYTTPPQRKPLTDEQMKKSWYSTKSMMGWYSFQEVTRCIEAAHGIKE